MARHDYESFGESAWPRRDFQDDERYGQSRDRYGRPLSRPRGRDESEPRQEPRTMSGSYNSDWRGDISARDTMNRAYGMGPQTRIGPREYGGGMHQRQSLDRLYGRSYGQGYRNEFDETADQSDRTYGTRLGQGMNLDRQYRGYGERDYGGESFGYGRRSQSVYGGEGFAYEQEGHEDSALTQITHRIGSFVKGVFSGKKPFRGPKGYMRSDERIREDVCDALANLGDVDPSEVEVSVSQAEVTLTGSVPFRHWKHTIEDAAEAVFGVKDVINHIRVKSRTEQDDTTRGLDVTKTGDMDSPAVNTRRNANRITHS